MDTKIEDLRIRRTKKQLTDAMDKILNAGNLSNVSINQICEEADINRSTFYKHFDNKQDLVQFYVTHIVESIFANITEYINDISKVDFDKIMNEILKYQTITRNMIDFQNFNISFVLFNNVIADLFSKLLTGWGLTHGFLDERSISVCCQFYAGGTVTVFFQWLCEDEDTRVPASVLSHIFVTIFNNSIGQLIKNI